MLGCQQHTASFHQTNVKHVCRVFTSHISRPCSSITSSSSSSKTRLSKQKLSPAALPVSLLGHTRRHAAVQAAAAAAVPSASSASPGQQQQLDVPPGFDLPVAIALAAAAFEAYLEPVGANQQFKEVTVNNTHVTYTDRSFLQKNFEGLLQLTVHGAKDLKAVNITGGSDPYVVMTLGDSSATTEVVWGDVSPKWAETHYLYVQERAKALLKLRVIDKNKLMSDVDLGVVMTGLQPLLDKPGRKVELPLKGTNAQGKIIVSALFLPFSNEIVDAAVADDTKRVPETPSEVTQIAAQLEVAMAVQDQLTSTVQQVAADLQQKVGLGGGTASGSNAAPGTTANQSQEAAAAGGGSSEQSVPAASPELGAVVQDAEQRAVETLSSAMDALQQRLSGTGLVDQAEAVAQGRREVTGKVHEAAQAVAGFVKAEGLSSLPVNDLGGIIARIAASRMARDPQTNTQQELPVPAAAAATDAAVATAGEGAGSSSSSSLPPIVQEAMPQAWKALASVAGKMVEMFRPVAFVENTDTDTQVWVYACEELKEVVVAFRGTEQVKWKDLVSDLNLVPTSMDYERTGAIDLGLGSLPLPFAKFKKGSEIMVHSGFLGAYDSVRNKVFRVVEQLTASRSAEEPWTVFVTGHSLGGALATLAAYDIAGRKGPAAVGIVPYMYTFGAPRVGNKAFADDFNKRLKGNSWRITNSSDIVPSVPRLMGYAHVQRGVRLDSKGCLNFEQRSKDVLGEGREVAEVISDLASQALEVAAGTKPLEEVVDAIREHEMEILNSLVDGSALGQHMEDFYLDTLKQAVLAANPALTGKVQQMLEDVAASASASSTPQQAS